MRKVQFGFQWNENHYRHSFCNRSEHSHQSFRFFYGIRVTQVFSFLYCVRLLLFVFWSFSLMSLGIGFRLTSLNIPLISSVTVLPVFKMFSWTKWRTVSNFGGIHINKNLYKKSYFIIDRMCHIVPFDIFGTYHFLMVLPVLQWLSFVYVLHICFSFIFFYK